jgi:teichuronic acid biosynthesis glycosyltransferase TuaH
LFSTGLGRVVTESISRRCIEKAVSAASRPPAAVINASPVVQFPSNFGGTRLLHLTDDWLAAADLIGFPAAYLRHCLQRNLDAADVITAVSAGLAAKMSSFSGRAVGVLPNGCRRPAGQVGVSARRPVAALVGQLNERLDMDVLELLAAAGIPLLVIGPRTETSPGTRHRLDAFLSRSTVDWRGSISPGEVKRLLRTAAVGLTPYADTEFNRSSFPLKTLEYLSVGVPVVATDLPSVRGLTCSSLAIAKDHADFLDLVRSALKHSPTDSQREEMRNLALANSWDVRAAKVRELLRHEAAGGKVQDLARWRTP